MLGARSRTGFDWILLATVLALCGLGVLTLYSIPGSNLSGRYLSQLYWVALGLAVALALWIVDYRILHRLAYPIYFLSLGLLLLTLVGPESITPVIKGARRWIRLGGFQFQPSEISKLALILVLARHFHDRPSRGGYTLWQAGFPLLLAAVPMALILKQPDLGTALLHLFIAGTMILFAKLRWSALVTLAAVGIVALPVGWNFLSDYQKARIEALFNPELDQKKKGWQSRQAVIATSSGQLTGRGFRKGPQTQGSFVPEQWNDMIFSGWGEEWGFLGCFFLLALFYFLIVWSLHISAQARERHGAFLAAGCGCLIFFHVAVNVGMVTRLLPVVGIPLPFFSYGGSAMLTMMFAVGVLLSVSSRRRV